MKRRQRLAGYVLTLMLGLTAPLASRAAEPALPEQALAPGTTFVMWTDIGALREADARASLDALLAIMPEAKRAEKQEAMEKQFGEMSPLFEAGRKLAAEGMRSAVVTMTTPEAGAPGAKPLTQLFLETRPGSDPPKDQLLRAAATLGEWVKRHEAGKVEEVEQFKAQLEAAEFTRLGDRWYAVEHEAQEWAPLPEADEASDPAPFVEALQREAGAPLRFALVMSPGMREQVKAMANNPNAAMMGGLLQPLARLETASGGLTLGDQPGMRLALHFENAEQASMFKSGADGMIQFMGQMMLAQGNNPKEQPDPEKMRNMQQSMPLLFFEQEAHSVSKSFDLALFKKLAEAGWPIFE